MTAGSATATEVRARLVETLRIDLVGPTNDHAFARELLPQSPSVWYLTGFLVPSTASKAVRTDASPEADEEIEAAGENDHGDDGAQPQKSAPRKGLLPASMGISVLVPAAEHELSVAVSWGDYAYEVDGASEAPPDELDHPVAKEGEGAAPATATPGPDASKKPGKTKGYRRTPRDENVRVRIPKAGDPRLEVEVPHSAGLYVVVTARTVGLELHRLPRNTRAVSIFVVNRREAREKHVIPSFVFQVGLEAHCESGFVPRVDPRNADGASTDPDEGVADLHFRDVEEFAVGHGVSAGSTLDPDGKCRGVWTTWIPDAEVLRVVPSKLEHVELSMEALGRLADGAAARAALDPLVAAYRAWIEAEKQRATKLDPRRATIAQELLQQAEWVADRIEYGVSLLADPLVLDAFRIANRAMAKQARRRRVILKQRKIAEKDVDEPRWYPFQLAFLLAVLRGLVEPKHSEREHVDLLFFPTGGGKTEAYLGLAAFAMVLRRLRDPGPTSAGTCVLMRYTLRLLTLDQLSRATALICALELERENAKDKLGEWPFEIGLWVGRAATPNRMGRRGDGDENSAYTRTDRYQRDSSRHGAPIPIEDCPWCGERFEPQCFRLSGTPSAPTDLKVHCRSLDCEFNGARMLPMVTVDEPIYRRLPAFLIATVDKFAALPWTAQVGALFGRVDRHDTEGFYGPADPGRGQPMARSLPPPDFIIQDELHLISGPLGTIAGVYEAGIEALCTREVDGQTVRPKIIASTATVRRAAPQIRALFGRANVSVFPPPGVDREDSFFARTVPANEKPARLYVGVAAQGRSLKVVFLRTALALLSAGQRELAAGGEADPYLTLLAYFNSLRELGGSRRIVEDEVKSRLEHYGGRKRREPADATFVDRSISFEPLELTSRVSTNDVAEAKRRLALPFVEIEKERVDVALATNMISVGLDIQRLGLMLVLGQPKASAEYIQATSRVGRQDDKPGLVVTLLNPHKARDRSHYERFRTYHASFYRSVEATSVTPFSPRALDRALAATLVGMCRHGEAKLTPPKGASEVRSMRLGLERWVELLVARAKNHANLDAAAAERLASTVRARARKLLDDWVTIVNAAAKDGQLIQYQSEIDGVNRRLLHDFLDADLEKLDREYREFRAARSMRDVEASADLSVKDIV